MAETLARRGALTVLPQDVAPQAVAEIVALDQVAAPRSGTRRWCSRPGDAVADALNLLPKRAHGAVVVVDDGGRPIGTVDEAACTGVDRFTRLADVLDPAPLTFPLDTPPREVFEALGGRRRRARARRRRQARRPAHRARRAARRGLRPGARRRGEAAHRGRRRDQRRRRGQGEGAARAGVDVLVVDTAHGHQDKMLDALRAVRAAVDGRRIGRAGGRRQRRHRRGRARPGRGGRRHRQGRRRAGRDVHHADDDRRRAAAVLRGAGVRRGGPRARRADLGRRRRAAPPRRGARPGRGRVRA